jgi:hypothetical protein
MVRMMPGSWFLRRFAASGSASVCEASAFMLRTCQTRFISGEERNLHFEHVHHVIHLVIQQANLPVVVPPRQLELPNGLEDEDHGWRSCG